MADLRVSYNALADEFDFDICRGTVFWDNGLYTAVILSLFTDARALDDDDIPDGTNDRRGWWGDDLTFNGDIQFGSRRWLLTREKQQDEVLRKLEEYDSEALKWLVDKQIASRVEVIAENAGEERWLETIRIYRNDEENPFEFVWQFERYERQTCRQKFEQPPVSKIPLIPLENANWQALELVQDLVLASADSLIQASYITPNDGSTNAFMSHDLLIQGFVTTPQDQSASTLASNSLLVQASITSITDQQLSTLGSAP